MTTGASLLFDTPGPRARRRARIATVVSCVVISALAWLALAQFDSHGQLARAKWEIFLQWPVVRYLLSGLGATLKAALVAGAIALPIGGLLTLARLSRRRTLRRCSAGFVELFRAIPVLLLLYVFLIFLPRVGLTFPIFWQLVIPIVISNAAVLCEVFRAGVTSLDRGQYEAAVAVGLNHGQAMRLVIVPQAVRRVAPALVAQMVRLLKESTLGYVVSYPELLYNGKILGEFTHSLVQTYLVVAVVFIAVNQTLAAAAAALERRQSRPVAGPAAGHDPAPAYDLDPVLSAV